jgi:hypothetical protein
MTQPSNTNRAIVKCSRDNLCEQWLRITKELHGLSESEIVLAAKFLNKRIELKEKITDEELLDEYLQSSKVRSVIKQEANVKNMAVFQNMMSALRKKGFFGEGDRISKAFIPNINTESKFLKIEFILKADG